MTEKNYWVRASTYVTLQRLAIFVFGFGSYFFMVRYFSKDTFGVWTLFVVITSVVEMSRSAFIQNAFVKFYSQPNIDRFSLTTASITLNFISTVVFIALMLVLIPVLTIFWHTTEISGLIFWYCATSLILVPLTQLNYLEQANQSFRGVFWSAVVRQGFFFSVVAICFLWVPNLSLNFFAAMQSVGALAGLTCAWILSKQFAPRKLVTDRAMVRNLFKFGKYILGTGVASTIGKNADQILLGSISHSSVALYNAAVRVMNFVEIPTLSISNIVYPKIAERANLEGSASAGRLYEKSVATIVGIILPVILGVLVLPDIVLLITAGKNYLEAAPILRIMATASILIPFNVQVGSAFEVIGKPHVSFYINISANVFNLALNIILIPRLGIMGAVWSMLFTNVFIFVVSQVLLKRELSVSLFRTVQHLFDFYRNAPQQIKGFISRKK
ncbi:flippase [Chryseolinea lacunae]|uniref:Flippase n=1 Tax=Chryseolinea lacunae TaxID=2801331 RepID=A0ABS1KYB0_9BACT|nr:flippase [Chryseolinea lacunae]MBL0744237.1 flippase [Chryseolinea lacunae]